MRTVSSPRPALLWTALAAALVAAPGLARADVVGDPPPECPAGSLPDVCHGGPFCRPAYCAVDSDCLDGATCQDTMACVGSINCQGGGPEPSFIDTYEGECAGDSSCAVAGAVCQPAKRCIPLQGATTGAPTSGDSATGTGGGTGEPTGGATVTASGGSSDSSDSDGNGDKTGCSCTYTDPRGAPGLFLLLALRRRRR